MTHQGRRIVAHVEGPRRRGQTGTHEPGARIRKCCPWVTSARGVFRARPWCGRRNGDVVAHSVIDQASVGPVALFTGRIIGSSAPHAAPQPYIRPLVDRRHRGAVAGRKWRPSSTFRRRRSQNIRVYSMMISKKPRTIGEDGTPLTVPRTARSSPRGRETSTGVLDARAFPRLQPEKKTYSPRAVRRPRRPTAYPRKTAASMVMGYSTPNRF